jgi:hypothetical protein
MKTRASLIAVAVCMMAASAFSQEKLQRNLDLCLSGKYPALCNHGALTPDQLQRAGAAEKRENLRVCMTGKYPALCDHSKLAAAEVIEVKEAERVENLKICLTAKYSALCKHSLLSLNEQQRVRAAEEAENLGMCMDGRYAPLCKHSLLTPEQAKAVAAAESTTANVRPHAAQRRTTHEPRTDECTAGHWIDSVAGDGQIVKLEDGSLWRVDDVDTVTTMIWLPVSDVLVCGTKMINVDDDESVTVTRMSPHPDVRAAPLAVLSQQSGEIPALKASIMCG